LAPAVRQDSVFRHDAQVALAGGQVDRGQRAQRQRHRLRAPIRILDRHRLLDDLRQEVPQPLAGRPPRPLRQPVCRLDPAASPRRPPRRAAAPPPAPPPPPAPAPPPGGPAAPPPPPPPRPPPPASPPPLRPSTPRPSRSGWTAAPAAPRSGTGPARRSSSVPR